MKKSIKNKLAGGFGFCLLLMTALVVFNFSALREIEGLFRDVLKRTTDMELAVHAQHIGEDLDMVIGNAVIVRNMARTERDWAKSKEESLAMIRGVAKAADTPEEHAKTREAEQAIHEIIRMFEKEMLPLIRKGEGVPGPIAGIDVRIDKRIDDITLALGRVAESMSDENREAARKFRGVLQNTMRVGLIFSLVGVVAALSISSLTTRRIVRPLAEITRAAREMKNGNYLVELEHRSDDEIGLLAATFSDMSGEVEKRTVELQESNESLQHEIAERKAAEENVRRLNDELEQRVAERTAELVRANEQCRLMIDAQEKSQQELRNLSQHLQTVREEERTAIARDIHDELGQLLTALNMDLLWLRRELPESHDRLHEKTLEMERLFDEAVSITQRICAELRPGILDDLGLAEAIEWHAHEIQKRTGIVCEVRSSFDCSALDRERSTALFRIFQEALTNICRHAEATRVRVDLSARDGELITTVTDNGKGIAEEQISDSKSLGLIGMRERVRPLGGEVNIRPLPDGGTCVRVSMPLGAREKEEADDENPHRG